MVDGVHFPLGNKEVVSAAKLRLPATQKRLIDPSRLTRPVRDLHGVGKVNAARLTDLGLRTLEDLLLHIPFRHEPPSRIVTIAALRLGEEATLRATVRSSSVRDTRRRNLKVVEALVADGTSSVVAVWYNQAYLKEAFGSHPEVLLRGRLTRRGGVSTFVVKSHEIIGTPGGSGAGGGSDNRSGPDNRTPDRTEGIHVMGLVPVYPTMGDLSVRTIRTLVRRAVPEMVHLVDPVPARLLAARRYPPKPQAVYECHFPATERQAYVARNRLAFEELLLLQLSLLLRRRREEVGRKSRPLDPAGDLSRAFLASLPYAPTAAQLRVLGEIDTDLSRSVPMRRLLQGDVGSGKTMVATYSLLRAVESGGQGALMAPTEVLADQHAARLDAQLAPLGLAVWLLKGSQTAAERRRVKEAVAGGEAHIVLGTHALIQEGVAFKDLRVAVVDEQHRFGVRQRDALTGALAEAAWPHTLHMTATPIPRTLSLTFYGDLDLSVIDELPPGRTPVRTQVVLPHRRSRMWEFVRGELDRGRQAYVVCPLIEESESVQAGSAKAVYEELAEGELKDYRLRLLHGQLPLGEKQAAMAEFSAGEVDVLVATTVIEVGIDVPNATVMVIEGARRFGLSQLHQLRGRVGRGTDSSRCFLLADPVEGESQDALARLRLFASTNDGFALAEADLHARGAGQLFGERQSGLGDLRIANVLRDRRLLTVARKEAEGLLAGDPGLSSPVHRLLREAVDERFGERVHLLARV